MTKKSSPASIFADRLPAGSGVRQQLQDLTALARDGDIHKIHRNFLFAALGINCLVENAKLLTNDATNIVPDDLSSILERKYILSVELAWILFN